MRHLRAVARVPPTLLVLTGIVSVQVGASLAKQLFGQVSPTTTVVLRLVSAAVVLAALFGSSLVRAIRARPSRTDWLVALGLGAGVAVMNWSMYQSFARIPLGLAVTIEFLGPLAIAIVGLRRRRDVIWVILAGGGVALLGFAPTGLDWLGVGFAALAGLAWAGYIVFTAHTGRRWPGLSGLVLASLLSPLLLAGPAIAEADSQVWRPQVLLLGVAVGILSSVIPYALEMVALRRMPQRVLAILLSLEPAAAALAGMILLGEVLEPLQWLAVLCVVLASVGATRSAVQRTAKSPSAGEA